MKKLTTAAGAPVGDNNNSQTAGPRGPVLLQDVWLLEKLAHFDREVIPERRMHAKGSGAFGTFTVTHDITRYTKETYFRALVRPRMYSSDFLPWPANVEPPTPSVTFAGLPSNFIPAKATGIWWATTHRLFFLRDPLKFPDLNHAVKRDPRTNMRSARNNWDFWTLLPEALHQVTIVMSDRGLPYSYRHMHGFGSHTFSFISPANERFWVKFTWKTQQGIKNLTDQQACELVGDDRESAQRDLYTSIEEGRFPQWKLYVQIMPEAEAGSYPIHPFDLTKVWPHKDHPLIEVGVLELNRNPDNYFVDVEQAAFNPANVVPGISFSPDKMLQARLFSYGDAQRYRVGVNHHQIPVNAPRCPVNNYHRDGLMRTDANAGSIIGYEPNSHEQWVEQPDFREPPLSLQGSAGHWNHREDDDYFSQPGALFRLMDSVQKQALFSNTARSIRGATAETKQRHINHCTQADPEYGSGVAQAIKLLG